MKLVVDMIKYYIKWHVHQRKVSFYKSTKKLIRVLFFLFLLDIKTKMNTGTVKSISNNIAIFRIFFAKITVKPIFKNVIFLSF